jgi:ribosome assembly protein YihI (activator of Der GTPase)
MTRKKKSRTSGQIGIRHKPTAEARQERDRPVESKKKGAGLKSGSRNSIQVEAKTGSGNQNKDPRHGSKKPIALVVTAAEQKLLTPTTQPKALLAKAKPVEIAPQVELEQIEQDEQLQALLERVEQGEILTGKDAKYFNAKTARHAELLSILGLDDDEEGDDEFQDDAEDLDPLSKLEQVDWRKDLLGE